MALLGQGVLVNGFDYLGELMHGKRGLTLLQGGHSGRGQDLGGLAPGFSGVRLGDAPLDPGDD